MAVLESAVFWIVVAAASEIIALSPMKDNSIVQLVFHAINSLKPGKKIWTSQMMGSGYLDLAHVQISIKRKGTFKSKSSTLHCQKN